MRLETVALGKADLDSDTESLRLQFRGVTGQTLVKIFNRESEGKGTMSMEGRNGRPPSRSHESGWVIVC
jgi:hypothetical protein